MASLLFLAAYAVRVLAHGLPPAWRAACLVLRLAAWAIFAVDYAVRWRLSGQRLGFVRGHLLDTVVLALPLLRPLRVVRFYDAVQRHRARPRLALYARVMLYAGLSVLLLGFAGALAVYHQEHTAPGATIRDGVVLVVAAPGLRAGGRREAPGGPGRGAPRGLLKRPARRQTCTRSSTTFTIFAMASSTGMPFSCEPSR